MVTVEDFRTLFAPPGGIRVELDWDALATRDIRIRASCTRARDELLTGFFPWYLAGDGTETDYSDPDGSPVALSGLPEVVDSLAPDRRAKIDRLRRALADAVDGVQLVAPAYDLGRGRRLYLDGCHRLAALSATSIPIRALILSLEGPVDPRILPDLVHWVG